MAASQNVWQPEANPTTMITKENGKLKCTAFDVSANIDLIGWNPSALGYDGALSRLNTVV
jgi:hypothetical protein